MEENNNNYDKFTEDEKIEEKDILKQLALIRSVLYPIIIITFFLPFVIIASYNGEQHTSENIFGTFIIVYIFVIFELLLLWGLTKDARAKIKEAQHNDRVRKDARIWYKEFKRLELEDKKKQIKLPPKKEL